MVEILRYKRTIPDLLVGILAINNFCLIMFSFTPTAIAQAVDHWFGESICYMHAILNNFFIANIFCVLVFMSVERWWAICKPFHYQRVVSIKLVSSLVLMLTIASGVTAVVPPVLMPVTLLPGWYCDVVFYPDLSEQNSTHCPQDDDYFQRTLKTYASVEIILVFIGLFIECRCNTTVVNMLKRKVRDNRTNQDMKLENV